MNVQHICHRPRHIHHPFAMTLPLPCFDHFGILCLLLDRFGRQKTTPLRPINLSHIGSNSKKNYFCRMGLRDESAAAFWKACTRFKAVTLSDLFLIPPGMDCWLTFEHLKYLELTQVDEPTMADYKAWFSKCPQLQRLCWECDRDDTRYINHDILEGMAQLAFTGRLQSVQSLYLDLHCEVCNIDSVSITGSMVRLLTALETPLQSLHLNCGQNMEETTLLQAIQRHGNQDRGWANCAGSYVRLDLVLCLSNKKKYSAD